MKHLKTFWTIVAMVLSATLFAQTQPQNWSAYPINISTQYLTDNLNYEVLRGNATVSIRNRDAQDTLGFIVIASPANDTSEVAFTFPIESLSATQLFGGTIGITIMNITSTSYSYEKSLEYSTDGVHFQTSVKTLSKKTFRGNGGGSSEIYTFTIPQTTTHIRYTYIAITANGYTSTATFRFQIDEYMSTFLPKKELWYNFGEKGEFGYVYQVPRWSADYRDNNIYFYETGGLSENFAARQIVKFPSNGYWTSSLSSSNISDIEDVNNSGQMDMVSGNYLIKKQLDGTYSYMPNAGIIPNLDINRDGRLDYLYAKDDQQMIAYQQPNGQFSDAFIDRKSFDEYYNTPVVEEDEWVYSIDPKNLLVGKSLPSSMQLGNVGGCLESSYVAPATSSTQFASAVADLNKDGMPDMLAPERGLVYYGLGNNTFVYSSLDGNVMVKDLNNDGVSDYIVYNGSNKAITAHVYQGEGQFKEQVLMRNLAPDANIHLYDFDKDGDIDVLITFSAYLNGGTAHTLFARNDGNGNLDAEDESLMANIDDDLKFAACTDLDNDGFFDLLNIKYTDTLVRNNGNNSYCDGIATIQVRRGKANFSFEDADSLFSIPYYLDKSTNTKNTSYEAWKLNAVDIDRDGINEVWLESGYQTISSGSGNAAAQGYIVKYNNTTANTRPQKPEKPNLRYNAGGGQLDINWKLGSDTESSPVDLTYALRVGTAPGLDDIFATHAFADGTRKNFRPGNRGSELSHTFDVRSWKPGTYYVSVQVIDPIFAGSEFSEEAVFEHTYLPNEFSIARTNQGSITAFDTLQVSYNQYPESELVYNWDFAGAEVVDSTLGHFKLRFAQPGEKTISLAITSDELTSDKFEINFYVLPNKVTWDDSAVFAKDGGGWSAVALQMPLADYNMDGLLDAVMLEALTFDPSLDGLWQNTGNGRFTKNTAAFNSTLSPTNVQWMDINNNGRLDMFYRQSDESRYLNHSNTTVGGFGNLGFASLNKYFFINGTEEETWSQIFSGIGIYPFLMDLTNNGKFDVVHGETNAYYGTDDYYFNEGIANTTLRGVNTFNAYNRQWLDFNKDGFMDFCGMERVYRTGKEVYDLRFYENLGTGSITDGYATPEPFRRLPRLQRQNAPVDLYDLRWIVQDMNADGFYDFVYFSGTYKESTYTRATAIAIEYNNQNQGFGVAQEISVELNNGVIDAGARAITAFDFDNNGYIDILTIVVDKRDNRSKPYIFYFDANGYMAQGFLYDDYFNGSLSTSAFADIDGDGIPDFYSGQTSSANINIESTRTLYLTKMQSVGVNTKPQPPGNLVAQQTEKGLLIEWDPAEDAETPFALMRYNLSVKKKGSNITADAYIISPLNGGDATMAVLPRYYVRSSDNMPAHHYIEATKFFIPASVLSGEVEIMVQAIDQWDAQSDFTQPLFVKISDVVNLAMSSQACFDEPITVTFTGTQSGTPVWDFDGADIVSGTGFGPYEVKWQTPGIKTVQVSLGTDTSTIQTLVYEEMKGFAIPDSVFVATPYAFTYPALLPRENTISFHLMLREQDQGRYPPKKMKVQAPIGGSNGTLTFEDYGFYNPIRVRMTVSVANNICTTHFDEDIQLMPRPVAPQIEYLAQTNGKLEVRWDSQFMDERIDTVVILKEGAAFNQFIEIGRVPKSELGFIDMTSNLNIRSEAYLIEGLLPGGIKTLYDPSKAHQSPRLSITKDETKNTLIWSQYIGTRINNFTILRGATPETMNEIATLEGHRVFYVDENPNPEELYYALQYDPIPSSEFLAPGKKKASKASRAAANVQSNVVFAGDASQIVKINKMNILAVQKTVELNNDQHSLYLYPEVFPANATYQNVIWSIVSGDDKATISDNGILTGKPNQTGSITVKVESADGSNISATRVIQIKAFSTPCDLPQDLYVEQTSDSTVSLMWDGSNDGYKLSYYDTLTKNIVFTKLLTQPYYNLTADDYPRPGTYAWTIRGICGTDTTDAVAGELFTVTKDTTVPTPVIPQYTVTITPADNGDFTVKNGNTIITSGMQLDSATVLTLHATPNTDYEFSQWWDNSTVNPRTFTLNAPITISATFEEIPITPPTTPKYTVSITTPNNGIITVMDGSMQINDGAEVDSGTVLTLTAIPNTNYLFEQWWDNRTDSNRTVVVQSALTISATFVENPTTAIQVNMGDDILKVYPNPVTDILHIQTEQVITQIVIVDLQGKVLQRLQGNLKTMDMQAIPTGNYILRIHTQTAIVPVKIVKQ
ncbi:MAG: FG-GAP-like repeat-containing protein [Bacteroidales bacterium]|jgi:hypothetical protein|nr:FG-GAP-like repeat-containing protein [Bacteroidales bacterium]